MEDGGFRGVGDGAPYYVPQIDIGANIRFPPHPSATLTPVSLRLGHARVLTVHRTVIHYARAASLPRPTVYL